jgi:hypothetical protein
VTNSFIFNLLTGGFGAAFRWAYCALHNALSSRGIKYLVQWQDSYAPPDTAKVCLAPMQGYFSVSAQGRWYACHRAIGQADFELGSNSGLDVERRRDFLARRNVHAQTDCGQC